MEQFFINPFLNNYLSSVKPKKSIHSQEHIAAEIAKQKLLWEQEAALLAVIDQRKENGEILNIAEDFLQEDILVKVFQIADMTQCTFPSTPADLIVGIAKTACKLKKQRVVPGMPGVIKTKPIKKRKDLRITHHVIKPFPRPQSPIDLSASNQLYDLMHKEAMRAYISYMRSTALTLGIPFIAVDVAHVKSPIDKRLYQTDMAVIAGVGGMIYKEFLNSFIKNIPPDNTLHVVWADGGNMIPSLARADISVRIFIYSFIDFPVLRFDQYYDYIKSPTNQARIVLIEINDTLKNFFKINQLSGDVIANYVPFNRDWMTQGRLFSYAKMKGIYNTSPSERRDKVLPPGLSNNLVRNYVETFRTSEMLSIGNSRVEFVDRSINLVASYDHHQAFVDAPRVYAGELMVKSIANALGRSGYNGSAGIKVSSIGYDELPFSVSVKVEVYQLYGDAIDYGKVHSFYADQILMVEYMGELIIGNKRLSRYVEGFLIFVLHDSKYYLLDAAIGGTFLERYWHLYSNGFQMVNFVAYGDYCIASDTLSVGLLYAINYTALTPLDVVEFQVSSVYGIGLAMSVNGLIYDGSSRFFRYDNHVVRELSSETILSWRVRFKRRLYVRMGNFCFLEKADPLGGLVIDQSVLQSLSIHQSWIDELEELIMF